MCNLMFYAKTKCLTDFMHESQKQLPELLCKKSCFPNISQILKFWTLLKKTPKMVFSFEIHQIFTKTSFWCIGQTQINK